MRAECLPGWAEYPGRLAAKAMLGWAAGQAATGRPGQTVVSVMISLPGRPDADSCRPSQAGRNTRRA